MKRVPFDGIGARRMARVPDARWFEHLQLWRPEATDELVTGDHESAVLLLGGTFDLVGGNTSWPLRGARTSPFEGRPMAVYLPPETPFRVHREQAQAYDEILLIAARMPEPVEEPRPHATLSDKPLLPLAGSGKAFDPATGEWKPAEAFASSPESLPPRRFERHRVGALTIERVFPVAYKAATLSVDELVLPAAASLSLSEVPARPDCDEALLYLRPEHGEAVVELWSADELDEALLDARGGDGRTHVVIAYAGKR